MPHNVFNDQMLKRAQMEITFARARDGKNKQHPAIRKTIKADRTWPVRYSSERVMFKGTIFRRTVACLAGYRQRRSSL